MLASLNTIDTLIMFNIFIFKHISVRSGRNEYRPPSGRNDKFGLLEGTFGGLHTLQVCMVPSICDNIQHGRAMFLAIGINAFVYGAAVLHATTRFVYDLSRLSHKFVTNNFFSIDLCLQVKQTYHQRNSWRYKTFIMQLVDLGGFGNLNSECSGTLHSQGLIHVPAIGKESIAPTTAV